MMMKLIEPARNLRHTASMLELHRPEILHMARFIVSAVGYMQECKLNRPTIDAEDDLRYISPI